MRSAPRILSLIALVLTSLFAAGGLLFALGYAFDDPGGWAAVLIAGGIVLPLAGLSLLAARKPKLAHRSLVVGVALFTAWCVLTLFVNLIEAPVTPIVALILSVPIAVLGQRRPARAGILLLAIGALPLLLLLVRMTEVWGPEQPGMGSLLTGSTGVVVIPIAAFAVLFLAAGALQRRPARSQP